MATKGLAVLVAPVLVLVASAWAQEFNRGTPENEVSVTAGRTFVSTQTILNPTPDNPNPHIHFGNRASFDLNYARLLMSHKIIQQRLKTNDFSDFPTLILVISRQI